MSDQVNVQLKEDPGKKPKGWFRKLAEWLGKRLMRTADSGGDLLEGKAREKTAKANEIEEGILDQKKRLDLEKLKERNRHKEEMKKIEADEELKKAQAVKAQAEAFAVIQRVVIEAEEKGIKLVGIRMPAEGPDLKLPISGLNVDELLNLEQKEKEREVQEIVKRFTKDAEGHKRE